MKNIILAKPKFVYLRQSKVYLVFYSFVHFQSTDFTKYYSREYCLVSIFVVVQVVKLLLTYLKNLCIDCQVVILIKLYSFK